MKSFCKCQLQYSIKLSKFSLLKLLLEKVNKLYQWDLLYGEVQKYKLQKNVHFRLTWELIAGDRRKCIK